jgi:hypothetical protein
MEPRRKRKRRQHRAQGYAGPTAQLRSPTDASRAARRRVLLVEAGFLVVGAAATAASGGFGLPVWAVVVLCVGFTAATTFASNAAVGPESERVFSLWATVVMLAALLVGIVVYVNRPGGPRFVQYINSKDVVLSPFAGAPPRSDYNAAVLIPNEEHSAECYVVVRGEPWLFFQGSSEDGWAPRSAFRLAPDAHATLPAGC